MDKQEQAAAVLEWQRRVQGGVVSHAQLLEGGESAASVKRALRRRELALVHPRVYVDHTGPLKWDQRCWAAVLWARPAALCGPSVGERPDRDGAVHVIVEHSRRLTARADVVLHRTRGLHDQVIWNDLPRLRPADNALLLAAEASSELDVIGALTAASDVSAYAWKRALARHPRVPRRALIVAAVDDLVAGTASVLEHEFLKRVARAHGLPSAARQAVRVTAAGIEYRDVEYTDFRVIVELDGQLNHESWRAQGRDADRDLDDVAAGKIVVRLRWRQVLGTPCRTADRLARILQRGGWTGRPTPCGPDCTVNWGVPGTD